MIFFIFLDFIDFSSKVVAFRDVAQKWLNLCCMCVMAVSRFDFLVVVFVMLQPAELRLVRDNAIEIANSLSSKVEGERLGKLALLSPFAKDLSLDAMQNSGFELGYSMWKSARAFAHNPTESHGKSVHSCGRKRLISDEALEERIWILFDIV